MVVPVLMTNCQVSEKLNIGPVMIHARITNMEIIKAVVDPANSVQ